MALTSVDWRRARLLAMLEKQLTQLPPEQQRLVAWYALGLRDGLHLCSGSVIPHETGETPSRGKP